MSRNSTPTQSVDDDVGELEAKYHRLMKSFEMEMKEFKNLRLKAYAYNGHETQAETMQYEIERVIVNTTEAAQICAATLNRIKLMRVGIEPVDTHIHTHHTVERQLTDALCACLVVKNDEITY